MAKNDADVNWLDVWKGMALRSKLLAGVVGLFILFQACVKIVDDVSNLADRFGASERSVRIAERSARLSIGAFELGGDLPMAVYGLAGGDTGIVSLRDYESRVRANLNLLGIDVKYPPDIPIGQTPMVDVADQILFEQVRPGLARLEDPAPELAFQYGYHWSQALLTTYRITSEAMPESDRLVLFASLQANARAPEPEKLEADLGLSPELTGQAEAIRRDITSLKSETDVTGLYVLEAAITGYANDVWHELCSRAGADCGYEIGVPPPSP